MSFITVAAATLPSVRLDFAGNRDRILESIKLAKDKGAKLRTSPKLEVLGYGCLDHHLEGDTFLHSWVPPTLRPQHLFLLYGRSRMWSIGRGSLGRSWRMLSSWRRRQRDRRHGKRLKYSHARSNTTIEKSCWFVNYSVLEHSILEGCKDRVLGRASNSARWSRRGKQ
jgi:hypothetical protein